MVLIFAGYIKLTTSDRSGARHVPHDLLSGHSEPEGVVSGHHSPVVQEGGQICNCCRSIIGAAMSGETGQWLNHTRCRLKRNQSGDERASRGSIALAAAVHFQGSDNVALRAGGSNVLAADSRAEK